eukprot:720127_1
MPFILNLYLLMFILICMVQSMHTQSASQNNAESIKLLELLNRIENKSHSHDAWILPQDLNRHLVGYLQPELPNPKPLIVDFNSSCGMLEWLNHIPIAETIFQYFDTFELDNNDTFEWFNRTELHCSAKCFIARSNRKIVFRHNSTTIFIVNKNDSLIREAGFITKNRYWFCHQSWTGLSKTKRIHNRQIERFIQGLWFERVQQKCRRRCVVILIRV